MLLMEAPRELILSLIRPPGTSCPIAGNVEEHVEMHQGYVISKIQTGKFNRSKGPDSSKKKPERK